MILIGGFSPNRVVGILDRGVTVCGLWWWEKGRFSTYVLCVRSEGEFDDSRKGDLGGNTSNCMKTIERSRGILLPDLDNELIFSIEEKANSSFHSKRMMDVAEKGRYSRIIPSQSNIQGVYLLIEEDSHF